MEAAAAAAVRKTAPAGVGRAAVMKWEEWWGMVGGRGVVGIVGASILLPQLSSPCRQELMPSKPASAHHHPLHPSSSYTPVTCEPVFSTTSRPCFN
eukprot:1142257-Pelagomonas_calceolata.AAC.5